MPAVAKSPITLLVEALAELSVLKSVGIRLYAGMQHLAQATAPRRIVFYPTDGTYTYPLPASRVSSAAPPLAMNDQQVAAHLWAASLDDAWDMQQRLLQALATHTAAGGPLFLHDKIQWSTDEDTSLQGVAATVFFRLQLPITRAAEGTATIVQVDESTRIVNPATGGEQAGPTITIT